ncbi:MAG: hypothetical protein ACYSR0_00500 [Planctomycetota bacterium]|jgi:hypothetical protein
MRNNYIRYKSYVAGLDDIQAVALDKSSGGRGFSVFVHYKAANTRKIEFFFAAEENAQDFFNMFSEELCPPQGLQPAITYYEAGK